MSPQPDHAVTGHGHGVSRRQRQLDELRALCGCGAVGRAIDLAYEHFADFGYDEEVIVLIAGAVGRIDAPSHVRIRFADLSSPKP